MVTKLLLTARAYKSTTARRRHDGTAARRRNDSVTTRRHDDDTTARRRRRHHDGTTARRPYWPVKHLHMGLPEQKPVVPLSTRFQAVSSAKRCQSRFTMPVVTAPSCRLSCRDGRHAVVVWSSRRVLSCRRRAVVITCHRRSCRCAVDLHVVPST